MSGPAQSPIVVHAPHAALLIDFDNVTMGIRSDLTKELKALLSSDIIRGKVTVQRAYADWRRYPQYVMPLTERSIDMIWATAVGSTKKNATDIRLAIDAIELVFTRPEIGTYIILSGDSDFSSLVLKLKEYGKYVVGIGIRESASDLLIQNCDEYYSYSELAGLNKEVDAPSVHRDPWDLVRDAVALMVRNGDVMRSDRLKQVMQQIDPNFDERNAGFNRFSKFVTEAGTKGLLTLSKLENGQYEVGQVKGPGGRAAKADAAPAREDSGRRGRGRGRDRERREPRPTAAATTPPAPAPPPKPERPEPDRRGPGHLTLGAAFILMSRALGEIPTPAPGDMVRARMAALHGREDPLLDPERFPRLLRQANDAEIAEVRKLGDDGYEVSLSRVERAKAASKSGLSGAAGRPAASAAAVPPKPAVAGAAPDSGTETPRTATLRFRRGSRMPNRPQEIPLVGVVAMESESQPAAPVKAPAPSVAEKKSAAGPTAKAPAATKGRRATKKAGPTTTKSRKPTSEKAAAAAAMAEPAAAPKPPAAKKEPSAGPAATKPRRTRTRAREKKT